MSTAPSTNKPDVGLKTVITTAILTVGLGLLLDPLAASTARAADMDTAEATPDTVEITASSIDVKTATTGVETVKQGETYPILGTSGSWFLIEIRRENGKSIKGYVRGADVRPFVAAPPPAFAAPVDDYFRVTDERASAKNVADVVATLSEGQIFKVLKTQGDWLRIAIPTEKGAKTGWVSRKYGEILPGGEPPTSLTGLPPASQITATITYNWTERTFIVRAKVPLFFPNGVRSLVSMETGNEDAVPRDASTTVDDQVGIQCEDDTLVLTFGFETFARYMAQGSRSIWIREELAKDPAEEPGAETSADASADAKDNVAGADVAGPNNAFVSPAMAVRTVFHHRIDFAPLNLENQVKKQNFPDYEDGVLLVIETTGVLPGFVVEYADDGDQLGSSGRVNGVEFLPVSRDRKQLNRVRLSDVYASTDPERDIVRLILPFSEEEDKKPRFYRFRIRNRNGAISNVLAVVRAGDRFTEKATSIVAASNVTPDTAVKMPSLELMSIGQATSLCRRLGRNPVLLSSVTLEPMKEARVKSGVVLRQGIPEGTRVLPHGNILLLVEDVPDAWSMGMEGPVLPPVVDVDDDLGFVPIHPAAIQPSSMAIDDSTLPEELTQPDAHGMRNEQAGVSTLAIRSDLGVDIDPFREPEDASRAAALKMVIDAVLAQPSSRNLPGAIGKSITEAIDTTDDSFQAAASNGNMKQLPVEDTLRVVMDNLEVTLDDAGREQVLRQWQQSQQANSTAAQLDRNGNGRIADDVAIMLIELLLKRNAYDPTKDTLLTTDAGGTPIAVFGSKGNKPVVVDGGEVVLGKSETDGFELGRKRRNMAKGPEMVASADGPDLVLVPEVASREVAEVRKDFGELGLQIDDPTRWYDSDVVTDSDPRQQTWTESGTKVDLDVIRRVPNVVKMPQSRARKELAKFAFDPVYVRAPEKATPVVVAQDPTAGEFAPIGSDVKLECQLVVPNVTDMLQPAAVTALDERGFEAAWDTRAFEVDKVASQDPKPGRLAELDSEVRLVLVLPVPNVVGRDLAYAERHLKSWDLDPVAANRLAHPEDTVRGQNPAPRTFVPHESTVKLDPVKGIVPNVQGTSVGNARRRLEDQEDYVAAPHGALIDSDIVTSQKPAAGTEYERGGTVTLDARVHVPNVQGQSVRVAERTMSNAAGNLRPSLAESASHDSDVVYSQDPRGGSYVLPRTTVSLVRGVHVPNLRGMSPQNARGALISRGIQIGRESSGTRETVDRNLIGSTVVSSQSVAPGLYKRSRVGAVDIGSVYYIMAMRTVPRIGHMTVVQAFQAIQNAGLEGRVRFRGQLYNQVGWSVLVIAEALKGEQGMHLSQGSVGRPTPPAGTRVPAGSTVVFDAVFAM